jgi:hypothetical protein
LRSWATTSFSRRTLLHGVSNSQGLMECTRIPENYYYRELEIIYKEGVAVYLKVLPSIRIELLKKTTRLESVPSLPACQRDQYRPLAPTFQNFRGRSGLHYKFSQQTISEDSKRSRRKRVGIKNTWNEWT